MEHILNTITLATQDNNESLRKQMASNRIFDILSKAIVQMELIPGTLLSEADIAKRLGVSRQPVREAFIKLEEAQLVEIRPQRGTFVRLISQKEVKEIGFIREAIEVAIMRKAVQSATSENIERLHAIIDQQKQVDENDNVLFLQLDEAFHSEIARSAQCEYAIRILSRMKLQLDRVRFLSTPKATPIQKLISQHSLILRGIERRKEIEVEAATREHMEQIIYSLPILVETYPDIFSE